MRLHHLPLLTAAVTLGGLTLAHNDTFVEDFEGGNNVGSWSWGTGNESISPINGNPGAYLQDLTLFACCPSAATAFGVTSIFTGDYRSEGVVSLGIDLITLDTNFSISNRPLTVILVNDGGTPFGFGDDFGAYFIGDKDVPDAGVPGQTPPGWTDFDFVIPSAAASLPTGWRTFEPGGIGASDAIWNAVIEDVHVIQFFYGDPTQPYLTNAWDVGMDNPRITRSDESGPGTPFGFGLGCPCGNDDADAGCVNSAGRGAHLVASGSSSVAADDLVLQADQLPSQAFGILFMGTLQLAPLDFGNGLRVVGGNRYRYPIQNSGAGGILTYGPGLGLFASGSFPSGGQLVAGSTWNFQIGFRDVGGPCGQAFNVSNGVAVTLSP